MQLRLDLSPPMADVLALYSASAPMKPVAAKTAILQIARSEVIGFRADDELVAAAMLYPLPPVRPGQRHVELAFACLPAVRQHLVGLIRLSQLTRSRLVQAGAIRVQAHVAAGHVPGRRLARLIGMVPAGRHGAFERYVFEGQPDVEFRERLGRVVQRAGYVETGSRDPLGA